MHKKLKDIFYKLRMNFHYRNVMKVLFIFFTVMLIINCLDSTAHASGILDYGGKDSPFDKVKNGWGQFMNEKYRNNYYLDPGDIGGLDILGKTLNGLANMLFSVSTMISWVGLNVFNLCFNNNITGEFAKVLDSLSRAFTDGVFNKFFLIMFMISMISVVIMFAKRNYAAVVSQFLAVFIILTSVFIISNTGARNFVVSTTKFSKDIGSTLVSSMNEGIGGKNSSNDSSSEMLGTMWGNLVHIPWITLEFNGNKTTKFSETSKEDLDLYRKVLSKDSNDDSREKDTKDAIGKVDMTSRVGATLILALITIIKVFVIIVIGVLQIFLQIVAIAIILISPLFFLLAIVPQFGGTELLKWVFDKFLGVQLGIILLSFVIALLLLVDSVTLNFFTGLGASFTVATVIQCVCWVLVVVFRKQIMNSIMELQNKIGKGTAKYLHPGHKMLDKGAEVGEKASKLVTEPVKKGAINIKDNFAYAGKYAKTYGKNKAKLYTAKKMSDIIDKVNSKFNPKDETSKEDFENNNKSNQNENKNSKYKGETIDFENLKARKKAEKATQNNKTKSNENSKDKGKNKENTCTNIKDEVNKNRNLDKERNEKNNNKFVQYSKDSKEKNNKKINDERKRKDEGVNVKDDVRRKETTDNKENNNEAKSAKTSISNEKGTNNGKENTKKNLNNENKKEKNNENNFKDISRTKINNSKNKEKKSKVERAEKLKTLLGVNKSQIRAKERKYDRELKKLKIEKRNKKIKK